jgi:DNA-binding transcriptional regulator YiaG
MTEPIKRDKRSRLTTAQVQEIRALRANENHKLTALADTYGVSFAHIAKICSGARWAKVP